MRILGLLKQYNNLQPDHVKYGSAELRSDEVVTSDDYIKLFNYATKLEAALKEKNARENLLLNEIHKLNQALKRKHFRVRVAQEFFKVFKRGY